VRTSIVALAVFALPVSAVSQTTITFAPPLHSFKDYGITQAQASDLMDLEAGTIRSRDAARRLIESTLKKQNPSVNLDVQSFYCIINVVRWTGTGSGKPRWYVYHASNWGDDDFSSKNRIFGVKNPWILIIHLNSPGGYDLSYQINVKHRLPANIQHLSDLAHFATTTPAAPDECAGCIWAAQSIDANPPSDIDIAPQVAPNNPATIAQYGSRVKALDDKSTTFDNEGLYHWDVSLGIPIRSYKQLNINSTNGSVTAQNIDRRNLLALFDYYPKAVDLKGSNFAHYPYFVGGVAFASKPLQKALVGIGWGPTLANFYAGCMIVTQRKPGASSNEQTFQFAFGLNLPVRAIADKLGIKP
jgi:hypothetical protein